jgi:hypothetical protein
VGDLWEQSLEKRQQLIPRKCWQGTRLRPGIEDECRGISHRHANAGAGNANFDTGAYGTLDVRGRHGCQERSGSDRPEGVEPERLTEQCPFREYWKLIGMNVQTHTRGLGQFPQARGHTALGRVMHSMHLNGLLQHLSLFDYAKPWLK